MRLTFEQIISAASGIVRTEQNDCCRKPLQSIESETTEYIKKLKDVYENSKIVSILPLWTVWNGEDENFKTAERACLKNVYEKYSDYIIDGYNLVPHDKKYFADEVHPNDEGFAFYGDNLVKELEVIMAKKE